MAILLKDYASEDSTLWNNTEIHAFKKGDLVFLFVDVYPGSYMITVANNTRPPSGVTSRRYIVNAFWEDIFIPTL